MENKENAGQPPAQSPKKPTTPRTRAPSNYPLPSERFGFPDHLEILRRFALVTANGTKTVGAMEVGGGGVPKWAPPLNTGFLCDMGLLSEESRGKFKPTAEAMRFLSVRSADEDRSRPILRAVIENKWFADAARSFLQSRPVVTEQELVAELGIVAQTNLHKKARAVRVLVDYLVYSGLVIRTEQGLALGTNGGAAPSVTASSPPLGQGLPSSAAVEAMKGGPTAPLADSAGWETIQTNDFFLRIRAKASVVSWLRKHLDLLDEKLASSNEVTQ